MATITAEELKQNVEAQLQTFGQQIAQGVVKYVEGKEAVLKTELTEEITKQLSGIEGLGEQLEKIQAMADSFAKVFDEDKDGKITPEEILAKTALLQQAIDGVNGRVDALTANVEDFKKAFEDEFESIKSRISALEVNTAKNTDAIAEVKANITTNYFTKEEVNEVLTLDFSKAVDAFNAVLFPEVDSDSTNTTSTDSTSTDTSSTSTTSTDTSSTNTVSGDGAVE